jgi:ketosteroid isomerase-like protein
VLRRRSFAAWAADYCAGNAGASAARSCLRGIAHGHWRTTALFIFDIGGHAVKRTLFALVFAAVVAAPAVAQDPAIMATITKFADAFNKGDEKSAAAACADQTMIVDEFPPYHWSGSGTCASWMAAWDADATKNGITDAVVTLHAPMHVDASGDVAYVVVPADYAFKQHGKPVKESRSMLTVVLQKGATGWLIVAWTWSKH